MFSVCTVTLLWSLVVQDIPCWTMDSVYFADVTGTAMWFYLPVVPNALPKITSNWCHFQQQRHCCLPGTHVIHHCYCYSLHSASSQLLHWATIPDSSSALSGVIRLHVWWHKQYSFSVYCWIIPLNKDDPALLQDHPSSLDDPLIRQRFVSNNNLSVLQSSVDMELSVVYRNDVLLLPHLHANSSSPFTVTQPWLKSHFMFLFFFAH